MSLRSRGYSEKKGLSSPTDNIAVLFSQSLSMSNIGGNSPWRGWGLCDIGYLEESIYLKNYVY